MPTFPQDETKIIALAQKVSGGLGNNASTFLAPPTAPALMNTTLDNYFTANDAVQAAKAELMHKTQDKNDLLTQIAKQTRENIDYGVLVAKGDDAILQEIGWGNRAAPTALQPPGQCRAFEITGQGAGTVEFDWKEPASGGKAAAYKVQRSEDGSTWTDAGVAVESEAALFNQPTGKTLIYQVVAINKAGTGMASNTVSLTL